MAGGRGGASRRGVNVQRAACGSARSVSKTTVRRSAPPMIALLLAALALSAFAAIAPAAASKEADAPFVESVIGAIPGYDRMTDYERVEALRKYVYRRTVVSGGADSLLESDPWSAALDVIFSIQDSNRGGMWCGGAAAMLTRIYNAAGFRAIGYTYGVEEAGFNHVTTLVEVNGEFYLQDAYLNFAFATSAGAPMPFREVLAGLTRGEAPIISQTIAARRLLGGAESIHRSWADPDYGFSTTCDGSQTPTVCSAVMTFATFNKTFFLADEINEWLRARGYPADWSFFLLYPISAGPHTPALKADAVALIRELTFLAEETRKEAGVATPLHVINGGEATPLNDLAKVEPKGDGALVRTRPEPWTYSAVFEVPTFEKELQAAIVRVWMDVAEGVVGVTATERDDLNAWLSKEGCIGRPLILRQPYVELRVADAKAFGRVLLRNCSEDGASAATVWKIEVFDAAPGS